jgi:hypothetical protein
MPHPPDKDEFRVVAVQRGQYARRWEWEVYRNGEPLSVRLRNGQFWSERSAKAAGKLALREFFQALDREQKA